MRLLLIEQRGTDTIAVIRPVRRQRVERVERTERRRVRGEDGRLLKRTEPVTVYEDVVESLADYYADVWARSVDGDRRLHEDRCRCAACCTQDPCTHKTHGKPQWRTWTTIEADELPPRESRNQWRIRDGGIAVDGD